MAHRDFNILLPAKGDPPSFTLAGTTFTAMPDPPAGVLADLIISADGSIGRQAAAIVALIEGCLPEGEDLAFRNLIYSKTTVVPLETLAEVAEFLIEEYGKPRPTMPSSGSAAGSTGMPATPGDGADSSESTPVPSASPS